VALGLLARSRRDTSRAMVWLRSGLDIAEKAGAGRRTAECLLHLGGLALDEGRYDTAERDLRRCLSVLDDGAPLSPETAAVVGAAWRGLAKCYADQEDHERAAAAAGSAFEAFAAAGRSTHAVACLVARVRSCLLGGDDDGAAEAMRLCAELGDVLPPSAVEATRLLTAGDEASARADATRASALYRRALAVSRALGRPGLRLVVDCLDQLARAALDRDDLAESQVLYQEAVRTADQIGDRIAAVRLRRELGRTLRDGGDRRGAREAFRRSFEEAFKLGEQYRRWTAVGLLLLADLDEAGLDETGDADADERVADSQPGMPRPGMSPLRQVAADVLGRPTDPATGKPRIAGLTAPAEHLAVYGAVEAKWHDQQWLLRVRTADGEVPFAEAAADYLGPSVHEVMRTIMPSRSSLAGVLAMANPVAAATVS